MKFYKISMQSVVEGESDKLAFMGTRGDAKRLGREWNDGKKLSSKCGVEVEQLVVTGGKPGMLEFLNSLVGFTTKKTAAASPKGKKGKKEKKGKRLRDDEVPAGMQEAADRSLKEQGSEQETEAPSKKKGKKEKVKKVKKTKKK